MGVVDDMVGSSPGSGAIRSWLPAFEPVSHVRLRLFCFPHVGGSADGFRSWQQALPRGIEVRAVELPGRGRHREADFAIVDSYRHAPRRALACPISVFGGLSDSKVDRDELEAWAVHTTAACSGAHASG